ncbi:MAG: SpoIIE family protein phosphatase, partial [Acidobacteria bacterium]|nr:SpoIIE family protein phosphatase [Acidobacteriota bacterium]
TLRDPEAATAPPRAPDPIAQSIFRSAETILGEARHLGADDATADRAELQRWAERLRIVNEVHEVLAQSAGTDELLDLILDRVFLHMRPQHGAIFLKEGDDLVCARHRTRPGACEEFPESRSLVSEVIDRGQAAVVTDARTDVRFVDAQSMHIAGMRTLVAAPLLTPEGALGMIVLCSDSLDHQFSETDLDMLVPLASAAALRIRNVKLAEEAAERRRYEREVALARRIQEALLPAEMPSLPGYRVYGANTPSLGVSGDYFQVVGRPQAEECVVLLADVSGKGIAASLITAYLDALCCCILDSGLSPGESFKDISRRLHLRTPTDRFATSFLGFLDLPTGGLRFASAGHDPAILLRKDGEVEWLERTGIPLGLFPDMDYETSEVCLEPGDTLVLYSDGLTEAANPEEEEFGRERLAEVCRENRSQPPETIAASIDAALEAFVEGEPYLDDRTVVILSRLEE